MSKSQQFNTLLSRLIRASLGAIILFSSLLLFVNVVMRYLFLSPIFWAEELARYLMVWLIFLGAGELAGREGHISVNILVSRFGQKLKTILSRLVNLICLLFCASLTWYSWGHAMRVRSAHQLTPALELPMWWAYLAIPLGALLMSFRYAGLLINQQEETEQ